MARDLVPGGGPNTPFGLVNTSAVGNLEVGGAFGASLDTLAPSTGVAQLSSVSFTGVLYSVPASDSLVTTLTWTQARPTDVIWMGPILSPQASPTSEGLTWNSLCTIAGRVQLIFANSTITAVVNSVQTWGVVRLGLF
jgi:hypothetical protein